MKICIINSALPPQLDGIGDYTAGLAVELAQRDEVTILTGLAEPSPLPGVRISICFSSSNLRSFWLLIPELRKQQPDVVLLQYNPFSYGRRGWNPVLPAVFRAARGALPAAKFALMVHEPFMPAVSLKASIMSLYQRWQLWALGRAADAVFFSIEAWAERFRRWFRRQLVRHLPVSSNIPRVPTHRQVTRQRLALEPETIALGLFGTAGGGRMLPQIKQAAELLLHQGLNVCLVYVGPDGAKIRQALAPVPVVDCGALAPLEVSQTFAAFDVYLAPFLDGVSTRRTNFMTALQHGCATVATRGPLTDSMLLREQGHAFLLTNVTSPDEFAHAVRRLAADAASRGRLGREAAALFEREFSWPRIVAQLRDGLAAVGGHGGSIT